MLVMGTENAYFSPFGAGSETNTKPGISRLPRCAAAQPHPAQLTVLLRRRPLGAPLDALVLAPVLVGETLEELVGHPHNQNLLAGRRGGGARLRRLGHLAVHLYQSKQAGDVVARVLGRVDCDVALDVDEAGLAVLDVGGRFAVGSAGAVSGLRRA
jgi:hypothetical protein